MMHARTLGILALAVSGLALLSAPAHAGRGGRGGGFGAAHAAGGLHMRPSFLAAPRMVAIAPRPVPPPRWLPASGARPAYALPAPRPAQPSGATWTPHPGPQVVQLRRAVPAYRGYRYRTYGWGWGWGGGVPVVAAAPAVAVMADQGFLTGATPTGGCPPPPPELWIGGRLWIPSHQACDGSIVPGRWGAESPLSVARH